MREKRKKRGLRKQERMNEKEEMETEGVTDREKKSLN
jgi:hypothetical protein